MLLAIYLLQSNLACGTTRPNLALIRCVIRAKNSLSFMSIRLFLLILISISFSEHSFAPYQEPIFVAEDNIEYQTFRYLKYRYRNLDQKRRESQKPSIAVIRRGIHDNFLESIWEIEKKAGATFDPKLKIHARWHSLYKPEATKFMNGFELLRALNKARTGSPLYYLGGESFLFIPEIFGFHRDNLFRMWANIDEELNLPTSLSFRLFKAALEKVSVEEYLAIIEGSIATNETEKASGFEGYLRKASPELATLIEDRECISTEQARHLSSKVTHLKKLFEIIAKEFTTLQNPPDIEKCGPEFFQPYYRSEEGFWTLMSLSYKIARKPYQLSISPDRLSHVAEGDFSPIHGDSEHPKLRGGLHTVTAFDQYADEIPADLILQNTELVNGVRRIVFNRQAYSSKTWKSMQRSTIYGNNKVGGKTLFPANFGAEEIQAAIKHVARIPMIEISGNQSWTRSLLGHYPISTPIKTEIWIRIDFNPQTREVFSVYPLWQQPGNIEQDLNPQKYNLRQLTRMWMFWNLIGNPKSQFGEVHAKYSRHTFSDVLAYSNKTADKEYFAWKNLSGCSLLFSL